MGHIIKKKETIFQFPCQYPLKVMGRNTSEFYAVVSAIIEKHIPHGHEVTYATRLSSGGKYMSVTATFLAQSREQLNAIYDDLKRSHLVMMTF